MDSEAHILIVGPGAIGRVLACRWAEAKVPVSLLARTSPREKALARSGIDFTGTSGRSRRVRAGLSSARRAGLRADAAFFCVKNKDVDAAIRAARPFIGAATTVVGLLNGLGSQQKLRRAFGATRTAIGVCYFSAERLGDRGAAHHGGKDIALAETPGNARVVRAAAELLERGGWAVSIEPDEDRMLWTKLCFNAAGNPLGALCAAPNGELVRQPALRELMSAALGEATAVSRRAGHRLSYSAERMQTLITRAYPNDSKQRNSMLQDLRARRATEVSAILGPLLAAARRTKTPAPLLSRFDRLIRRLERLP